MTVRGHSSLPVVYQQKNILFQRLGAGSPVGVSHSPGLAICFFVPSFAKPSSKMIPWRTAMHSLFWGTRMNADLYCTIRVHPCPFVLRSPMIRS